jgi:hypothetical protein
MKDPAFLFYYDRFLSGTFTMTDEQVGQYVRLMCIQANKGYITSADMLHICKTYDCIVSRKFDNISEDRFANAVLTEVVNERKAYTESRRNNRKGKKTTSDEHMNNISETLEEDMVNVIVNKDISINDTLLIPKMLSIFKTKNSSYFIDQRKDFSALGIIARNISAQMLKQYEPDSEALVKAIIAEWDKLIDFILLDPFFCNYELQQIAKYYSNINQTRTNGRIKTNRNGASADASRPGTVREPM